MSDNRIEGSANRRVAFLLFEIERAGGDKASGYLNTFLKNKFFTPFQAIRIVRQLNHYDIPYTSEDFGISIRKKIYKEQLHKLGDEQIHEIWSQMTKNQKEYFNKQVAKDPIAL